MRKNPLLVVAAVAISVVTAACTAGNHGGTPASSPVTAQSSSAAAATSQAAAAGSTTPASCSSTKLQATDVGVTPTTITVEIMADIGASSIPGMANGSVNAVKAWAALLNREGGLACRQVQVRVFDSKIDPTQSSAGYLDGCENAFAMVGTYALAVSDVSTLDSCKDKNGTATGLPETPGVALNPLQACNKTDFLYGSTGAPCPAGTGTQTYTETSVYNDYLKQALGSSSTHGSYYVALTPPVIKDSAVPSYLYIQNQGAKADQMVGLPATATQANFTPIIAKMVSSKSQFYFSDSVFPTFLEAKAEAAAQGVSSKVLWLCETTCYTPAFAKAGGAAAVGTKVAIDTLPFSESNVNAEMHTFVTNVPNPDSFAMESWLGARLFQQAVQSLVAAQGPNALTRANILTALGQVKNFTDGGIIGPVTPAQHTPSNCIAVLNTNADGTFTRVWPAKAGTLACGTTGTISVNPETAFKG